MRVTGHFLASLWLSGGFLLNLWRLSIPIQERKLWRSRREDPAARFTVRGTHATF